jgi:hypothetical protein
MRQTFRQPLTVIGEPRAFSQLTDGECFTIPGVYGVRGTWIGFPVYVKVGYTRAVRLDDWGFTEFTPRDYVTLVRYGEVERP